MNGSRISQPVLRGAGGTVQRSTDTSSTSTAFATLESMTLTTNGPATIVARYYGIFNHDSFGQNVDARITITPAGGSADNGFAMRVAMNSGNLSAFACAHSKQVGPGVHTVLVEWKTQGGNVLCRPSSQSGKEVSFLDATAGPR